MCKKFHSWEFFKADIRLSKTEDAALKHELEPGLFLKVFNFLLELRVKHF